MDFGGIQESVILSIMFWPAEIGLNYPFSMSIRGCVAPRPSQILFYFWRVYISLVKLCVWDFEKCFRTKCYLSIPNTSRRFICYLPIPPTLLTSLLPNTSFFYFHFSSLCSRESCLQLLPRVIQHNSLTEELISSMSPMTGTRTFFFNSHIADFCLQLFPSLLYPKYNILIGGERIDQG